VRAVCLLHERKAPRFVETPRLRVALECSELQAIEGVLRDLQQRRAKPASLRFRQHV
jgi:hypothetical protein